MDISVVIAYLFGIIVLFFIAKILVVPVVLLVRLIINGILGGLLLALFNFVGGFWGLSLAINPVTALISGFLGIPGVLLLFALRYLM